MNESKPLLEREILTQLFERYLPLCKDCLSDAPKCDGVSLQRLCEEAISNGADYPTDKLHRWLGFVQGVLACQYVISVDEERDFTRPLFHALYGKTVKSFDSNK